MLHPYTLSHIQHPQTEINQDPHARLQLWLQFNVEQPTFAPIDIAGYGSSGGSDRESVYFIEGEIVSQAEHDAHEAKYMAAYYTQSEERDRLITEQAHLLLYDLIDRNNWHTRVDVEAVNQGYSDVAQWDHKDILRIGLTRNEIDTLIDTSESLVFIEVYTTATDDWNGHQPGIDGEITGVHTGTVVEDGVTVQADQQASDNTDSSTPASGGGGLFGLWSLLAVLVIWGTSLLNPVAWMLKRK